MRICLAFHPAADPGGITNHTEQLAAGLLELGHIVHPLLFWPKETAPASVAGGHGETSPYTGLEYDQRRGYSWKRGYIVPYRGRATAKTVSILNGYDAVIWQTPIPTKRKENRGNNDWPHLYDTKAKQIAVVHDGNYPTGYPWLSLVADRVRLAAVHHCAYNSVLSTGLKAKLIFNPQEPREYPDISLAAWKERNKGFLSVQTFKAWKHVPELVAAIPHLYRNVEPWLAGKGIDYYYLTSKDKCKWPGIWDKAIEHGMKYMDVITNFQRDALLTQLTCLVDPSWSTKYAQYGGHFNRVVVDAIKMGAVPIARPGGIGDELFHHGENCLTIPQNVTAEEYGIYLTEYCNMTFPRYHAIMVNALNLLPAFNRRTIAQHFVDLLEDPVSGIIAPLGKATLREFFNVTD